jgi:ABC-2 type transport system ATP-binding protein
VALLSGAARPRSGTVQIEDRNPHRDPQLRRRVGALLQIEPPLPGRTVAAAIEPLLGSGSQGSEVLRCLGLETWIDRKARGLSDEERRSVALALALATPDPLLVVLFEPFSQTPGVSRQAVLERIAGLSKTTCVICATSSVRDALALEGTVTVISRGRVVNQTEALALRLAPGNIESFTVKTPRPRELAEALVHHTEVTGVLWDEQAAPRQLRVKGRNGEATARSIVEAARGADVPLEYMVAEDPSLQLVQSASQGALRAAHDRAYRSVGPEAHPQATERVPAHSRHGRSAPLTADSALRPPPPEGRLPGVVSSSTQLTDIRPEPQGSKEEDAVLAPAATPFEGEERS